MKKESFSWPPGCLFTMTVHEELCCELEKKNPFWKRWGLEKEAEKEAVADSRLVSRLPLSSPSQGGRKAL